MSQPLVIDCREVAKVFRSGTSVSDLLRGRLRGPRVHALRDVSLRVSPGEIVGLLGENGAGKSTLLRLVSSLLLPDAGRLMVLGEPVDRAGTEFRRRVSYVVSDDRSFSWRLSGLQNLRFFAALYGHRGSAQRRRVDEALVAAGLTRDAERPVREYSTGMRSRLAFARALLGDPQLWLFDEPTRGLDPAAAIRLRTFIREKLVAAGATAMIATHDLGEVQQLCDRVLVLRRGELVGEGGVEQAHALLGIAPPGDGR